MNFSIPTQVEFFDSGTQETLQGIAYRNEIICACCGGIFEIKDVENITVKEWVNFSEFIK